MAVTNPLRIGIVLDDTLDRPDGVQQYVLSLGGWLSKQGHTVFYLVGRTTRQDVPGVHSLAKTVRVSFNANTLAIPLPAAKRKVAALLAELRLDVLHVQIPYSPLMAGKIIACKRQEALVGTFHILPYGGAARAGTRLLGLVQRKNLARFDHITATSPASVAFARRSYGVAAAVVPNPVDVAHFRSVQPAGSSDTYTIAFLGRLVERKGALQLLRAVRVLRQQTSQPFVVRIGGKGPLLAKLQQYTAQHGLTDIVHFDGFIAEQDKPTFLARANLAVFPAMAGESFGIVLTEAMASGAGVVMGGDNPGYQSVLGSWPECLVDAHNAHHFAQAMAAIMRDSSLQQRLHRAQQRAVKQYDVSVVGATMVGVYQQAILHKSAQVT